MRDIDKLAQKIAQRVNEEAMRLPDEGNDTNPFFLRVDEAVQIIAAELREATREQDDAIRLAIRYIHQEDRYAEGMTILAKIVQAVYPAGMVESHPIDIRELAQRPNSTFNYKSKSPSPPEE